MRAKDSRQLNLGDTPFFSYGTQALADFLLR
jgi:hypothetical protein